MSKSSETVAGLKEEGNKLFSQKKYAEAASKYTDAIRLGSDNSVNAVLYCNRAACSLALKRHDDALSESKKAVELDPHFAKAWGRLGAAHDALTNYADSIEAYQHALSVLKQKPTTTTSSSLRSGYESAIRDVKDKIMRPKTMALPVLMAMARAHSIPVPTPHTLSNMPTIQQAVWYHPKFRTDPPLRLLLIPLNQTEPLRQLELERGPNIKDEIARLLGCRLSDNIVLHSEDQVAYAKGKPDGVGIGRMHTSYEAFMDDFAMSARPINPRACSLLHRPNTHGPILVMKTTFIKAKDSGHFGRSEDILCWEKVNEDELKGDEFRKKREEWVEVMGSGDLPHVLEVRPM